MSPEIVNNQNTLTKQHRACELVLGEVNWIEETRGLIECPGRHLHTNKDGERDCIVFVDRVPTVKCFHETCEELIKATNKRLRKAIESAGPIAASPRKKTAEEKAGEWKRQDLKRRTELTKDTLLKEWQWKDVGYRNVGPFDPKTTAERNAFLTTLFDPGDVIWIGDKFNSGVVHGPGHFRTTEEWLKVEGEIGPFICPNVFKAGSIARSNESIEANRYLVAESDTLTHEQTLAIFRWLNEKVQLPLAAIVNTGGKSLHGWFKYPTPELLAELKLVLPILGCDSKMFTPSQPVRLPGCWRPETTKRQELWYLQDVKGGSL